MRGLRDAYRALWATPLASVVAIVSLTLGIGANTAIFSIINSLLLKSLPVHEPGQLVTVGEVGQNQYFALSYAVWKEIREQRVFDHAFAWGTDRVTLSENGDNKVSAAIWATGEFFEILGLPAVKGRTFNSRDDYRGGGAGGPVAVISYSFWQRRFQGASNAIGQQVTIERTAFTIIGVTPPSFLGLNVGESFDLILPLELEPLLGRPSKRLEKPTWPWLQIMARRQSAQTTASLSDALAAAQPRIRENTMPAFNRAEDRDRYFGQTWIVADASGGVSGVRRQYGAALITLLCVVGLVLLVACANIASLMLSRSVARRHECSVRLALGASRASLVRQSLAESLLLSTAGAALGFAFAYSGSRALVAQLSTWASTAVLDLSVDWRVLMVTVAVVVFTAVLFGSVPAYLSARVPLINASKSSHMTDHRATGLGGVLVVLQVGVSLVLVVSAGLFGRSFAALAYRDLGFDRGRVLVAVVDVRRSGVPVAERAALYERLRAAVAIVPGIESAATSLATPLGSAGVRFTPEIAVPGDVAGSTARILTTPVSPDWFRTFGTRVLAGRDFTPGDGAGAPRVAIVNEAFLRRYFTDGRGLGRTLVETVGANERRPLEIIGIVQDAAFATVRDAIAPTMYAPLEQRLEPRLLTAIPTISISIRAAPGLSPAGLTHSVATAISSVDGDLDVSFQTVAEQLSVFYIRERLLAMLSGFLGGLALLLAAIGLYGATAYSVTRRRTELGIRMALGATPGRLVHLVLQRVGFLVTLGLFVGSCVSLWGARYVGALLYGLEPRDPRTMLTAILIMTVCAGVAGWLPARGAARADPAALLRQS